MMRFVPAQAGGRRQAAARPFQLVRNFSLTGLTAVALVAAALMFFAREQGVLLQQMQADEARYFRQVQQESAGQQARAARADLLAIHEAGNVNLTRLFANALWERDLAPFVARAERVDVQRCRAIADAIDPADGRAKAPPARKACYAAVGATITALPGFDALNAKVADAMKGSSVFKVKVFDLRGITVYSSERAQVGEDKAGNAGFRAAATGTAASELTHRDRFSAFEGVVEDRDLISSYIPVRTPGGAQIVAVFEVYADVTPFLARMRATEAQLAQTAAGHQTRVARVSDEGEARIAGMTRLSLAVVAGLLLALFVALFAVVRRADRIIVAQSRERERVQQHLAQSEKMAALGQMVAGVAHQLNTPLAFSHNNVHMAIEAVQGFERPLLITDSLRRLVDAADGEVAYVSVDKARRHLAPVDEAHLEVATPVEMLTDTLHGLEQMRELVQNLREFTRLDRAKTADADLNRSLRSVVYIAKSVMPTTVRVEEQYGALPPVACNVSQLNQAFLNLVNNAAQAVGERDGTVSVRTRADGGEVVIEVADTGSGIAPEAMEKIWEPYYTTKPAGEGTGLGLPIAREIVQAHGGRIEVRSVPGAGSTFTVRLPLAAPDA